MIGVILYGPPASGKDTITDALCALDARYRPFQRLKVGVGKTAGYRMGTASDIDTLRRNGDVIWENRRYGSTYVVDRPHLACEISTHTPVLHLGQVDAVPAVLAAIPDANFLTVQLWCPRDVAADRMKLRGDDLAARLAAWDETEPLPHADLVIDTAEASADEAARQIDSCLNSRGK